VDEFDSIARHFRPLTANSPEALRLLDDAALLVPRRGFELVVTADAIVEGVHFLPDDPPQLVARKLLRVNLSDLAAKAAEPYGYMLTVAWSPAWDEARRAAFARGLGEDQAAFGLKLFGGDTVATPGPMTASVTMFGWVPQGRMVRRSSAKAGDVLLVSGTIGDGGLGLQAARGELTGDGADWLADRYRLPQPRLALRQALLDRASAAADVSDGLLADAGHIGEASGVGIEVALENVPVSDAARSLLPAHPPGGGDERGWEGLLGLATSGDDYEIVCTCSPERVAAFQAAALKAGVIITVIGRVAEGQGVSATFNGRPVDLDRLGWRHG
jgi:thiamine-monophosphate kinase